MDRKTQALLEQRANEIRKLTIEEIGRLSVGHIGGSVDLCELLAVLYFHAMHIDPAQPRMPERDRFVLSKGHGGPALYAALALRGYFPVEELKTLNRPGTNLPSHCDMNRTPGIDMTTGSLGQGFSCAVGMALGARMDRLPCTIFACIGDGESQEGQVWEAAMLAGSQLLGNLIAFTDYNKMQIDGYIEDVNGLHPLADKWEAFGWHVIEADGHNMEAILNAFAEAKRAGKEFNKPVMILMNTVMGKGVDFMEGTCAWHGKAPKPEQAEQALAQLAETLGDY